MVQEAKQDCYKKWYLPAGRVEVGESLQEALLREASGNVDIRLKRIKAASGHQLPSNCVILKWPVKLVLGG